MNRLTPLRRGLLSLPLTKPKPRLSTTTLRFYASNPPPSETTPPQPRLAQPSKYSIPSHPSRAEYESTRRATQPNFPLYPSGTPPNPNKHYPNSLPPPNTLAYRLLTSKRFSFYLSLSVLFTLAAITSITNFMRSSPYAHLVPEWNWARPGEWVGGLWGAVGMHLENESRLAEERRKERAREVERRGEYRRKHGLERTGNEGGWGGWGLRREEGQEEVVQGKQEGVVGEGR